MCTQTPRPWSDCAYSARKSRRFSVLTLRLLSTLITWWTTLMSDLWSTGKHRLTEFVCGQSLTKLQKNIRGLICWAPRARPCPRQAFIRRDRNPTRAILCRWVGWWRFTSHQHSESVVWFLEERYQQNLEQRGGCCPWLCLAVCHAQPRLQGAWVPR